MATNWNLSIIHCKIETIVIANTVTVDCVKLVSVACPCKPTRLAGGRGEGQYPFVYWTRSPAPAPGVKKHKLG